METTATGQEFSGGELRWIADALDQAQRLRVQSGERIRAVVQGRDDTWNALPHDLDDQADANIVLKGVRRGETPGPVPLLGTRYRRAWTEEKELAGALEEALAGHPVWPWMKGVKGVGPRLAGKLLARLDIHRAGSPSAFWAYCGLATVPGVEYRCAICGLVSSFPARYRVSGVHLAARGRGGECSGSLERARGPGQGVRVAQPKPARGEKASYDRAAKKTCYLIATSFLKSGGPYAELYRAERTRLDEVRPGWNDARRHMAALRKIEKRFLADLWLEWRERAGLPASDPHPDDPRAADN